MLAWDDNTTRRLRGADAWDEPWLVIRGRDGTNVVVVAVHDENGALLLRPPQLPGQRRFQWRDPFLPTTTGCIILVRVFIIMFDKNSLAATQGLNSIFINGK